MNPYVQYDNVIPLLAPQDTAATALASAFVDLKTAQQFAFAVFFGNIATGTADSNITVTVEAATVQAGTSAAAIAFDYRLSDAVGANAWGAITSATTTGATIASTDDNKILWIELDPASVAAQKADARWVSVKITPTADHTVTLVSALACFNPRYKGSTFTSAT